MSKQQNILPSGPEVEQYNLFEILDNDKIIDTEWDVNTLFLEYKERMIYWQNFQEENNNYDNSYDWWNSRYCDDHPCNPWNKENYEKQKMFEEIWKVYESHFTKQLYAVIYCGGDIFKNELGKERETRYVIVSDCSEEEARKIVDAKNKFLPKNSKEEYAYTNIWRLKYILGEHRGENGLINE